MAINLNDVVYELLTDLIQSILDNNPAMMEKFGISSAVYEEIIDELDRSGEDIRALTLPPKDIAFQQSGNRYPVDVFEMDDKETYGIECQLWSDGKASELTLTADLGIQNGDYKLNYKIIETQ
jgi:hypothetical protein